MFSARRFGLVWLGAVTLLAAGYGLAQFTMWLDDTFGDGTGPLVAFGLLVTIAASAIAWKPRT